MEGGFVIGGTDMSGKVWSITGGEDGKRGVSPVTGGDLDPICGLCE